MSKFVLLLVTMTTFSGMLNAQSRGPAARNTDVKIPTWQAPAFWDDGSKRGPKKGSEPFLSADSVAAAAGASSSLAFVAIVPCRLVDTRGITGETGPFGPPIMAANEIRTIPVLTNTRCNIPANARAYSVNFTVIPNGTLSYLSAWPSGNRPTPDVSILNSTAGQVIANAAVVPGCGPQAPCPGGTAPGSIDVFTTNATEVIIDINGYYADTLSLAPGTASAPAVTFGTDATTGIYSAGAGTINIATGGQTRVAVRSDGDLDLTGNIRKNGSLFLHNRGLSSNIGAGLGALAVNEGGAFNTAIGENALGANTNGLYNTANGSNALLSNTEGGKNTAVGISSLRMNTVGGNNTAVGAGAALGNTTGVANTAIGERSLFYNATGHFNTAVGDEALHLNTSADSNTAVGYDALFGTTGSSNTGFGAEAGSAATTGSYNVFLGARVVGTASDTNTVRIGLPYFSGMGQNRTFIAGIRGVTTSSSDAVPVVIDSNGQLGTVSSSRRFKEDIKDMATSSDGLLKLRPVTFRYKGFYEGGTKPIEYGLIAEEVAEVYPDLVVKGADGQVETIQYQKLTPMLLNELQKLHNERQKDHDQLRSALESLESHREEIRALKEMLAELLSRRDQK